MVTNTADLNVALQQLTQLADMLEGMRLHAEKTNSRTFPKPISIVSVKSLQRSGVT